jgi:hypothetical protein
MARSSGSVSACGPNLSNRSLGLSPSGQVNMPFEFFLIGGATGLETTCSLPFFQLF